MKEIIPDNEIVLEDHPATEGGIPWKVVRSKEPEKYVWLWETERWLKITDIFTMTSEELYDIYNRLIPYQEKEAERIRNLPKPKFDRITIPKINQIFPKLLV
jgi:hypothetical protein